MSEPLTDEQWADLWLETKDRAIKAEAEIGRLRAEHQIDALEIAGCQERAEKAEAVVDAARRYQHGLNTKAPTTEVLRLGFDLRDALAALDQQEKS